MWDRCEARPLAERAVAIDEAAYGPDNPHITTYLDNLALILRDLGQPDQAESAAERARAIRNRTRSAQDPG